MRACEMGVHGKDWREERGGANDVIITRTQHTHSKIVKYYKTLI